MPNLTALALQSWGTSFPPRNEVKCGCVTSVSFFKKVLPQTPSSSLMQYSGLLSVFIDFRHLLIMNSELELQSTRTFDKMEAYTHAIFEDMIVRAGKESLEIFSQCNASIVVRSQISNEGTNRAGPASAMTVNRNFIAVGDEQGNLTVWDHDGNELCRWTVTSIVYSLSLTIHGSLLVGFNDSVGIWNLGLRDADGRPTKEHCSVQSHEIANWYCFRKPDGKPVRGVIRGTQQRIPTRPIYYMSNSRLPNLKLLVDDSKIMIREGRHYRLVREIECDGQVLYAWTDGLVLFAITAHSTILSWDYGKFVSGVENFPAREMFESFNSPLLTGP